MEKAHCVDTDMLHNAFAISDVVTDFVIISLPVPMVCVFCCSRFSIFGFLRRGGERKKSPLNKKRCMDKVRRGCIFTLHQKLPHAHSIF